MKKLLSILTISTLITSTPAPLLANTTITRIKNDVGATAKYITNGFNIKIKNIVKKIYADNNAFTKINNKWYFVVWREEAQRNWNITKFKNDKVYHEIENHLMITQYDLNYWSSFDGVSKTLKPWKKDNGTYFKSVYRWNGVNKPITPEIDNNGNITNWNIDKTPFKQGISFSLADGSKNAKWSGDGMRLTVDSVTSININNSNVEEVYWDGVKQPQTSKQWTINIKPESTAKDHSLVIKYDINGTQYTSENIMVSMLAKIEPTPTPVQENLSDVIKLPNQNDLGNIADNNDDTIFLRITQKNSRIVDFSQIEISKKDNHSASLIAKPNSKSYKGSVDVTYNVVPVTDVDLKIDVKPTAGATQPDSDYLSQLDSSKMTNPVNTFYYANSESNITMVKPTPSSILTGIVYGCDDKWNKTSQSSAIDPTSGIKLDGGQLGANNGKYLIELENELKQNNIIYLQIAPKQVKEHYFDTTNGKKFEQWAEDNDYKNIRGYSASQLNKLFEFSKNWKQSLIHLDLKLDNFLVDNIKNVTQDEIDNYKTKMIASVKAQVEKYITNVIENTDYVISIDNLVAGDWTISKDIKVQAVDGSTKLLSFTVKTIPIKENKQPIPPAPDNSGGDSKLWIIGVVVGVLAFAGIAYLLFKRFVFDKYIYPKIKVRGHKKFVERVRKKEQAAEQEQQEKVASEQAQENRERDDEDNNNNKGGNE